MVLQTQSLNSWSNSQSEVARKLLLGETRDRVARTGQTGSESGHVGSTAACATIFLQNRQKLKGHHIESGIGHSLAM